MREHIIQSFDMNSNKECDIESKMFFLNKNIDRELRELIIEAKEGDEVKYTISLHFKDLGGLNG